MSLFEVLVGLATIGSFVIAFRVYRTTQSSTDIAVTQPATKIAATPAATAIKNDDQQKSGRPEIMIPEGVTFGKNVVLVPGLQQRLFTQAGRIEESLWQNKSYSWIQRGQVIGRYHMSVPNSNADYFRHVMGSTDRSIDIRSPVSGLVLFTTFSDFVEWPKKDGYSEEYSYSSFSVLIPEDEPPPEKNAYMFGQILRFIRDNRGPLFRHSPYWSLGPMDAKLFERLVRAQEEVECVIVDAMPRYQEFFEEARTRYPALRPYLKHLLGSS